MLNSDPSLLAEKDKTEEKKHGPQPLVDDRKAFGSYATTLVMLHGRRYVPFRIQVSGILAPRDYPIEFLFANIVQLVSARTDPPFSLALLTCLTLSAEIEQVFLSTRNNPPALLSASPHSHFSVSVESIEVSHGSGENNIRVLKSPGNSFKANIGNMEVDVDMVAWDFQPERGLRR